MAGEQVQYRKPSLPTANVDKTIQRKTEIEHTYGYITPDEGGKKLHYKVGNKMVAKLDPGDAVKGSQTGAQWDWMGPIREQYGAIVKGHLLNHDLGGFAKEENLYPITSSANQAHSANVEQKVKRLLFDEASERQERLIYIVEVEEAKPHDPKDIKFNCTWGWEPRVEEDDGERENMDEERNEEIENSGDVDMEDAYELLGQVRIQSTMIRGGNYGGFQGLPANKYSMTAGSEIAKKWYHETRREEQQEVNDAWESEHLTFLNGHISSSLNPNGEIDPNQIRDAVKVAWTTNSATLQGVKLNTGSLIPEVTRSFKKKMETQEIYKSLIVKFRKAAKKGIEIGLYTGKGRVKKVNALVYRGELEGVLTKAMESVEPIIFNIAIQAAEQLPQNLEQIEHDPLLFQILSDAMDEITEQTVDSIDGIAWSTVKPIQ